MKEKDIWVSLVTKDNFKGVTQTLNSIWFQATTFGHQNVHVFLIDKSSDSRLGEWVKRNSGLFPCKLLYFDKGQLLAIEKNYDWIYKDLGYDLNKDSIQRARIQLMIALHQNKDLFEDSIVWQIDDDMLFQQLYFENGAISQKTSRNFFEDIIRYQHLNKSVDASIGLCTYAPPIPILLYAEKQLSDIFFGQNHSTGEIQVSQKSDAFYHDLLPIDEMGYIPDGNSGSVEDSIEACLRGIPLTRPVVLGEEFVEAPPKPSLLRGANFAVFNPKLIWAMPHISFSYQGIIGRRSDMIHAWMLSQMGYTLKTMELSLYHNRNFPYVDLPLIGREYFADLIGAVAFRFLTGDISAAKDRFDQHKEHLRRLEQLSASLSQVDRGQLAAKLNTQVRLLMKELDGWDWLDLKAALERFSGRVKLWLDKGSILS